MEEVVLELVAIREVEKEAVKKAVKKAVRKPSKRMRPIAPEDNFEDVIECLLAEAESLSK